MSLLHVSFWEGCTHHPPGTNTLPISCRGTAKLFHMSPLIPLQCLEGFCSSTHTCTGTGTTFTFGSNPRLEDAAPKGDWLRNMRVPGNRWFTRKLSGSCDTW